MLLPAGAIGISATLATAPAEAVVVPQQNPLPQQAAPANVAQRLEAIRAGVSEIVGSPDVQSSSLENPYIMKVWWHNGWGFRNGGWGWHNGGWGNGGGWHNGGWGNGGGWRNGGWGNGGWGNGWHNGWLNA
jgi:rSAM-associated Gly-rich repeat protein